MALDVKTTTEVFDMYIANLEMSYAALIGMIELAKECNNGDNNPEELDKLVRFATPGKVQENRIRVIRAVYPEYRFDDSVADMAPCEE